MKKFFVFFLLSIYYLGSIAQPTSIHYEKKDFVAEVLNNPTLSLCDFKDVGFSDRTVKLESESFYINVKTQAFHNLMIKAVGKDDYFTRRTTYRKIAAAWRVFLSIQHLDICIHLHFDRDNIYAPKIDPVIQHKLSIVPLKLKDY